MTGLLRRGWPQYDFTRAVSSSTRRMRHLTKFAPFRRARAGGVGVCASKDGGFCINDRGAGSVGEAVTPAQPGNVIQLGSQAKRQGH
jgi:hypothetical protein